LALLWTVVTVLLATLEAVTVQFVSIWFAGGAFAALITAILGLSIWWQLAVFLIVSSLLLFFTRSFVRKLRSKGQEKTNSDAIIGTSTVVCKKISNLNSEGAVKIRDVVWTARSENDEDIEEGTLVTVVRIEGVKLIVKVKED